MNKIIAIGLIVCIGSSVCASEQPRSKSSDAGLRNSGKRQRAKSHSALATTKALAIQVGSKNPLEGSLSGSSSPARHNSGHSSDGYGHILPYYGQLMAKGSCFGPVEH